MRRRKLLIGAGAAAILRPLCAAAQPRHVPVIGVLVPDKPDPSEVLRLFRKGLTEFGYLEGRNIRLEIRQVAGDLKRFDELAAALVRDKVDIIAVWQTPAALAAKRATSEIPIVMLAVADPVGAGLVASVARPDNNVTGMAAEIAELGGKNLELLKQLLPSAFRVAALSLAGNPFSQRFLNNIEAAGRQLDIAIEPVMVSPSKPLADAFETLASNQVDAAVVAPNLPMQPSVELALRYHLPAAAPWRPFAEAGGLLAYTYNGRLMFRQAAAFVDKILKGAKPADLPVEQPTHFELIINLKTAKVLGITLLPAVLARADEVIE